MKALYVAPFIIQAVAIAVDEFHFHRQRGLPRWERLGHPLDTFTLLLCLGVPYLFSCQQNTLIIYVLLGSVSCLMITKDERVHTLLCSWREQWLHSILFITHPLVLVEVGAIWALSPEWPALRNMLALQILLITVFMMYQIIYWNFLWHASET